MAAPPWAATLPTVGATLAHGRARAGSLVRWAPWQAGANVRATGAPTPAASEGAAGAESGGSFPCSARTSAA